MPTNCGAYQIHIKISRRIKILIGAFGIYNLEKGYYIYTGSAMKNLSQRIDRHKRAEKKIHWHIDYLLSNKYVQVIKIDSFPSETRMECELNQNIANQAGISFPIAGFGSSDCKTCMAHLIKIL
ncbi:MAG: GIY-YIG nuclease family protein [Candidatus Kapabacteria bacterium]|nr:GIY-YIG nuclease family protein [Candidatus Kapabacteria bacterium]